jgi:hypothetical protein
MLVGPLSPSRTSAINMSRTSHARLQLQPPPQPRRHRPRAGAEPPAKSTAAYDRRTELARILPLWPAELADDSRRGRRLIIAKLRRALRAERRRGIAGHWTYDLARHVELLRVYRLELAREASDPPGLTSGIGSRQ